MAFYGGIITKGYFVSSVAIPQPGGTPPTLLGALVGALAANAPLVAAIGHTLTTPKIRVGRSSPGTAFPYLSLEEASQGPTLVVSGAGGPKVIQTIFVKLTAWASTDVVAKNIDDLARAAIAFTLPTFGDGAVVGLYPDRPGLLAQSPDRSQGGGLAWSSTQQFRVLIERDYSI